MKKSNVFPVKGKYLQQSATVVGPDGMEISSSRGTIVTPHGNRGEWRVRTTARHQWGVKIDVLRPSQAAARQWAEASSSVGCRWMRGILMRLESSAVFVDRVDPTVEYRLEVARCRATRRVGYLPDRDRFPVVHGLVRVGEFVMKPRGVPIAVVEDRLGRSRPSWKTLVQVFYRVGRDATLRSVTERSDRYRLSEEEAERLSDGVSAVEAAEFVVRQVGGR